MSKIKNGLINFIENLSLWFHTVLREKNTKRLNFFHKIRAIYYGFPNDLYIMYNLKKVNPKLYINEYQRYKSRSIDGEYKTILDNKLLFEKVFGLYLDIPKNLIIISDKEVHDYEGNVLDSVSIKKILTDNKYIIEPYSGTGGGDGVSLISITNNKVYIKNVEYTFDEFVKLLKEKYNLFVITKFVEQNDYCKKINPYSTNTIRIITLKDPTTNKFIIPCAIHRFGSKKSGVVDNASMGGFITRIDVENGVLCESKTFSNLEELSKHPDTNVSIIGTEIPFWDDVKEKLIDVASKYPYIPFIAWDVVITKNGFSVIEGNTSSGLNIFQIFGPIKDTKLGDFYKYYGIIK